MPRAHAVIRKTERIGPDDWETVPKVMDLRPETTVAEIEAWARGHIFKGNPDTEQYSLDGVMLTFAAREEAPK